MDPAFLTALVPLLAAVGGGMAFLINRADKRRERNEALLIEHLKSQLQEKDKENRKLRRENKRLRADGTCWREQLIANDIKPQPEHWTEPEDDDGE
ncbi:hypothetical protein [Arthrobacter luteolus]|uniref:hypothetical protein n=1 Tax=Arthrobacter luteolus TaxID=98672 RepID=UPI00082C3F2B|nr:hypothetical protein [Arthrobacter luteolus]